MGALLRSDKLPLISVVYGIHLAICFLPILFTEYVGLSVSNIALALLHKRLGKKTVILLSILIAADSMFVFGVGSTLSLPFEFQGLLSFVNPEIQRVNETATKYFEQGNITSQDYSDLQQNMAKVSAIPNVIVVLIIPAVFLCVVLARLLFVWILSKTLRRYVL